MPDLTLGAPAAIAAIALLSKCLRREIVAWLYALESVVRRLLIDEAARTPPRGFTPDSN